MDGGRRAVVTGAGGFIGSHLVEHLLALGHTVVGVDSFSEHYPSALKRMNIVGVAGEPKFELVEIDLANDEIDTLIASVDVVFHLAGRPGVRESWCNFRDYLDANIAASNAVFTAAAAAEIPVIYASSSSVYGNAARLPIAEGEPLAPISPYGASKVMIEALANAFVTSAGLDAVGIRYFSVYGPRQRPDMAVAKFIEALVEGRPLPVFGDGQQRRDMTYVGDAVRATITAAEFGQPGHIYNVASGAPTALLAILEQLAEVTGADLQLRHLPDQAGDVRETWGDISLAAAELRYTPAVSLRKGLERQVREAAQRRELAVELGASE